MATKTWAELVEAGIHFGHQTKRWNPKMKSFVMGTKNQINILNIEETVKQIDKAADFLADLASKGKKILFVGCKRQAQEAIKQAAGACGQFYVNHRWLGGTLTNMETIKKSIARLNYLEEIESKPEFKLMSKKELAGLNRERIKLERNLRGIRHMDRTPDAVVIVDAAREHIAVHEARRLKIPIVALLDTNADPSIIDYPITANDDAIRSIRIILQRLIDPILVAMACASSEETTPDLVIDEEPLWEIINETLPTKAYLNYEALLNKAQQEKLSDKDHSDLIRLTDELEVLHAKKLKAVISLAHLRSVSVEELAKSIGFENE